MTTENDKMDPIKLADGTVIKKGAPLFRVLIKSLSSYRYSSRKDSDLTRSGEVRTQVIEEEVIRVCERADARSFTTRCKTGYEKTYSVRLDSKLNCHMGLFGTRAKALAEQKKIAREDLKKMIAKRDDAFDCGHKWQVAIDKLKKTAGL